MAEGTFREDLYYRLNIVSIRVPPLRERREDVSALLDFFLARQANDSAMHRLTLSDDARELLINYPWPGNVRELSSCIKSASIMADAQQITSEDLGFKVSAEQEVEESLELRVAPTAPARRSSKSTARCRRRACVSRITRSS
jgi:DNA-binding NtrC family response regulator